MKMKEIREILEKYGVSNLRIVKKCDKGGECKHDRSNVFCCSRCGEHMGSFLNLFDKLEKELEEYMDNEIEAAVASCEYFAEEYS